MKSIGLAFGVGVALVALGGCSSSSSSSATTGGSGSTTTPTTTTGAQGGSGQGGGAQGGAGQGGSAHQGGGAQGGAGHGGAGGATQAGGPFSSDAGSSYETQTAVAADAKGGVVAAWIAFFADGTSAIGYAVSRDAGGHWTKPATIASPDGRFASNPSLAVDSQGRVTLAWLGFRADANAPDEHVYVARLDAKTEAFGAPVLASDDGTSTTRDFDKPELSVDANDSLLLTWADFTGSGAGSPPSLTFARSSDGQSFDRSTIVGDQTFGNLASLCTDTSLGPTAPLYLVHLAVGATVTLRVSKDQGKTWTAHATPAASVVFQDVSCVAKGTEVTIAYAVGQAAFSPTQDSPADSIQIAHSGNGGTAFDAPVTVATAKPGEKVLFPSFRRDPKGKLAVVHYEGPLGGTATLALSSSKDGATWGTSPIASAGTMTLDRTIASWLGATIGLGFSGANAVVTYADNGQNKAHVKFATVALP